MAYDPWSATQLARQLSAHRVPAIKSRAKTENFTEPTEHDGNSVLEWCLGNVVGHYDARSNVYPRKSRPELKIDAAITIIMGIARCISAQPEESRYNNPSTREVHVIEFSRGPPRAHISRC